MSTALAPAKINAYLDVLCRRADGFHEIETLFLALPWGDEVELTRSPEPGVRIRLEGEVRDVPADERNLAVRAAHAYLDRAHNLGRPVEGGVDIRLEKRIPVGAGLGGGSSDAAAVLRLLDRDIGVLSETDLRHIASSLGADVSFFVLGRQAAIGRGIGDRLESLDLGFPGEIVLVFPGMGHETARVYAHVEMPPPARPAEGLGDAVRALRSGDPDRLRRTHYNALTEAAKRAYPPFAHIVSDVERCLGRAPGVTGTGSTLYDWPDRGPTGEESVKRLRDLRLPVLHLRGRS